MTDDWPKGVSNPAKRALAGAGYTRLDELAGVSERQLAALHGMGPKALVVLRDALAGKGTPLAP